MYALKKKFSSFINKSVVQIPWWKYYGEPSILGYMIIDKRSRFCVITFEKQWVCTAPIAILLTNKCSIIGINLFVSKCVFILRNKKSLIDSILKWTSGHLGSSSFTFWLTENKLPSFKIWPFSNHNWLRNMYWIQLISMYI